MLNLVCAILSAVVAIFCYMRGWEGLFLFNVAAAVLNTIVFFFTYDVVSR